MDQGVSAIFAHNDLMAMGILDYCKDHSIRVPGDLRLVGFDDRELASACRPTLTTAGLPLFQIGQTAAQEMIDLLVGNTPAQLKTQLNCAIIQRESTHMVE